MHRNLSHSPCLRREQQNFKFAQRMMLISQQQKMKHNPLKYTVQLKLSFLAFRMLDWVKLCISLLPHSTMLCSVHTRGVQYNYTLQEQRPSSSYHRDNQITAENKTTIATEDLRTGRQGERKGREPQGWKNESWEAKLQIFFLEDHFSRVLLHSISLLHILHISESERKVTIPEKLYMIM